MHQPIPSVAHLRTHVQALTPSIVAKSGNCPAPLFTLKSEFDALMLHLRRAADCPQLDTLVPAILALDTLRKKLESRHRRQPVGGIAKIRKALDGIDAFIDRVPLVASSMEPRPCFELDIPKSGPLHLVMKRRGLPVPPLEAGTTAVYPVANASAHRPARTKSVLVRGTGRSDGWRSHSKTRLVA